MITNFKLFENNNIIEIYIENIYKTSPYFGKRMGNKYSPNTRKDRDFIFNKIQDTFLYKYVTSYSYNNTFKSGYVIEVAYDNEWADRRTYFRFKDDINFDWYLVTEGKPIVIDLMLSDAQKYNI